MSQAQAIAVLKEYLPAQTTMQVATAAHSQPWICTVHYVHDDQLRFYWLSLPDRRHSKEIAQNSNASVAVALKTDMPVVGLQAAGIAGRVTEHAVIQTIMQRYVQKFGSGKAFYDNFVAGENQHELYCFTPRTMVLFDELHNLSRFEWQLE